MKNKEQNGSGSGGWFKSLDRLTKKGKSRVTVSTSDSGSDPTDWYSKKNGSMCLGGTQSDFLQGARQAWLN